MKEHPFHALCPYFAMFPPAFVEEQLCLYTEPGDLVFDPFCGRGTTVFQSLLQGRDAAGTDINAVAACVSGAKADPPRLAELLERIGELEQQSKQVEGGFTSPGPFFDACFAPMTLQQILFFREGVNWNSNRVDRFLAALALYALHGESHRSRLCVSNRMPRTISTKPDYSVAWWRTHGHIAPERDLFEVLRLLAHFRFSVAPPDRKAEVVQSDARAASQAFSHHRGRAKLVVTSPPYLDVTDYAEDQWLRLWLLGGRPQPQTRTNKDDRHTGVTQYWTFLEETWRGLVELLSPDAHIVVRIGGPLSVEVIEEGLIRTLTSGLTGREVELLRKPRSTDIARRQTNAFRPGTVGRRQEHDFSFAVH